MQQTSSTTPYKYSSASQVGETLVSRQASGMMRDQSSAGEIVRAAANYASVQPTAATSYQATSYSTQPTATTSYQAYNASNVYALPSATTYTTTEVVSGTRGGTYENQALGGASYGTQALGGASYATQALGGASYATQALGGASYATQALGGASYATQALGGASYATQALGGASYGTQVLGGGSSSSVVYGAGQGGDYTSASRMMTGGERVTSTRKVSSTIIDEQYIGAAPQDLPTREVRVEGPVQDVVKYVTKKEQMFKDIEVPKVEIEWIEQIRPVERVEYVDRVIEVPQYQDVIREVKVPEIVERTVEVIKEVKVPRVNYIEKIEEVPGRIIEVPKPYTVEQKVDVTRYTDKQHPVVVAQTIKPYIVEGSGVYEVDVFEYEPQCIPVDVHVLKAVQAQLNGQMVESNHRVVTVPAAQYNTMLQQLNVHLSQAELQKLPYLTENGQVTFLGERITYIEPQASTYIEGLDMSKLVHTHEVRGQAVSQQQTTTTTTMTTTGGGSLGLSGTYGQSNYGQTYQVPTAYGSTSGATGVLTSGGGYHVASSGYQAAASAYPIASSGYQAVGSSTYQAEHGATSYGTGGRTQYSTMSTGGVRPAVSGSVKYSGTMVSS